MATYHGIVRATCLVCGKVTTDDHTLELLNDQGADCHDCQKHLVKWESQDGYSVITGEDSEGDSIRIELN